jgi:hypothetical protein
MAIAKLDPTDPRSAVLLGLPSLGAAVVPVATPAASVSLTPSLSEEEIAILREAAASAQEVEETEDRYGASAAFDFGFDVLASTGALVPLVRMAGRKYNSATRRDGQHSPYCAYCDNVPEFEGRLPPGQFYKGSMVNATLEDLGGDVFGMVNLRTLPFPISISSSHGGGRARVALAHELAHVADKLFKLGLSHDKVHDVGVFFASEGIPAFQALAGRVD